MEYDMNQEEQIIRTEYSELMQKSYIDYAMRYAVVDIAAAGKRGIPVMNACTSGREGRFKTGAAKNAL